MIQYVKIRFAENVILFCHLLTLVLSFGHILPKETLKASSDKGRSCIYRYSSHDMKRGNAFYFNKSSLHLRKPSESAYFY